MKKILFITVPYIIFIIMNNYVYPQSLINENSLYINIQDNIYEAFTNGFAIGNDSKLIELQQKIKRLKNKTFGTYWLSYSKYYESIFYLKNNDRKQAKKAIEDGINTLEKVEKKDSETYALLAHLISFSIQFEKGFNMIKQSKQVEYYAKKSINLDSQNPRAWYVLGCNDFYKPKVYGGEKLCEKYFLKAISLENGRKNPYKPFWGISDSYGLLINFYLDQGKHALAKKYLERGLQLYPNDYMLHQYSKQIK